MMKRLVLAAVAVASCFAVSISAIGSDEPIQPDTNIPAVDEFGPGVWQPNSITDRTPFLQGAPTHQDGDAGSDPSGAFRFICEAGQLKTDDPVVYPGQPGKSHLHDFYGNTSVNAFSTYEVQRRAVPANPLSAATPGTTCQNFLNASGYWNPAMDNGAGKIVRPNFVSVYYKRPPQSGPECTKGNVKRQGYCVGTPHRIRYVFGYDMRTNTPATGAVEWKCRNGGQEGEHFDNMVDALAACPNKANPQPDMALAVLMQAPPCWDGKNLDSPNGRSHVAYKVERDSYTACPLSHPYLQPAFELGVWYPLILPNGTVDPTVDFSGSWVPGKTFGWRLVTDPMVNVRPGRSWHADYAEGWDRDTKVDWTHNCIDKRLSCAGGDLGNGTALKEIYPLDYKANVRLANRPKMAHEMSMGVLRGPQ